MQLIYGNGGLAELPTSEESNILEATVLSGAYLLSGDSTAASPTLTNVADTSQVLAGDKVYGPGWDAGATVLSKTANTVTMTTNADHTQVGGDYAGVRDGSLNGVVVMAIKAIADKPIKEITIGDLTECDFTGYAASSAVAWSLPLIDENGNAFVTGDKKQFRATGSAVANSVIGCALVDAGKTTVYQVDLFLNADQVPTPVEVDGAGTGFDYVPLVSLVTRSPSF